MRLRNIKGAKEIIGSSPYVVQNPKQFYGKWDTVFKNSNPVHIEVGMGKGRFIIDMAKANPQINYLGIEMYDSVLLRAIQRREKEEEIPNLFFACIDAREIPEVFAPAEVERIYLNFSDPWPKDRHDKRRLTSRVFLERYDQILKPHGQIEFKTDNQGLFEFSLEEVKETRWLLSAHTFDLHKDAAMSKGNIMTEYEEKFSSMNHPICKMIIKR